MFSSKIKIFARLSTLALALCVLFPISASAYGTKLDNGRDWFELSDPVKGDGVGIAVSGNGQIIYSAQYRDIRFSSDGGANWVSRASNIDFESSSSDIATSSSGSVVVMVQNGGQIWVSRDYGSSWTPNSEITNGNLKDGYRKVTISSSGQYIAVMLNSGFLAMSSNYGSTFTRISVVAETDNQDMLDDVEISGSGSRIIVPTDSRLGKVFLSTNYGASFSEISALTFSKNKEWTTVDISGDGQTLLAAADRDNIWISRDGGSNWNESVIAGPSTDKYWTGATISYDGLNMGIGRQYGRLQTSADGGANWEARYGAPETRWTSVSSSQDGLIMYANGGSATIYKSLPTWIWYDKGTVTFFLPTCGEFAGSTTSISASSVRLEIDTMTAAANSDGGSYVYFSETDTALWGANYNYGQYLNPICENEDFDGNVTITRGPFISSVSRFSETSSNTSDFIQYIGNIKLASMFGGNYRGSRCGNLSYPHAANVTQSCGPGILADYDQLSQFGIVDWRDQSQITGSQGQQDGQAFIVVKIKKSAIAGAAIGTTFVATETFTLTSA